MTPYKPQNLLKSSRDPKKKENNSSSSSNRNAGGSGGGGSRASRRAELSSLLSAGGGNSTGGNGKGTLGEGEGRDSPLAASSEDLSTRSGSPRYNSTFNDDTLTK